MKKTALPTTGMYRYVSQILTEGINIDQVY